jgi:hypothetical protein
MGGRLWAKNREEGGGAEFGFSLRPYLADEARIPTPSVLSPSAAAAAEREQELAARA